MPKDDIISEDRSSLSSNSSNPSCLKFLNRNRAVTPFSTKKPTDCKLDTSSRPGTVDKCNVFACLETSKENFIYEDFEFILNSLQSVDVVNSKNETILQKAIQNGHFEAVRLLVSKKANLKHKNNRGCNVLHFTALSDNLQIFYFLMDFEEVQSLLEEVNADEQTPLHFAAKNNSINIINALVNTFLANREAVDYIGRTPLYLAAEYARKNAVVTLLNLNCNLNVWNKDGQTAIYWIITKIPEIANEALNTLQTAEDSSRVQIYNLLPLEPHGNMPQVKSVLGALVESKDLEIIVHPVIRCLINFKWNGMIRFIAWIDFLFTILNIIVWLVLGAIIPYNRRHIYNFPDDLWRIVLFAFGTFSTLLLLLREIIEVYSIHKYYKITKEQRKVELDLEYEKTDTKEYKKLIEKERKMLDNESAFKTYISDIWNVYDLITILFLTACIATHVIDILDHSENMARSHIRIMSVTVIFIAFRLLKVGRIIHERFGILVMTLYHVIFDIIMWLTVYIIFWLPYACAFWMIFGGVKFLDEVLEDSGCTDVTLEIPNCNTTSVDDMDTFSGVMFQLYRITLGQDYDKDNMFDIDPIMYPILTGTYLGLTTLLLSNIFIAMLSATFQRLYDNSKANMLLQRAMEVINLEQIFPRIKSRNYVSLINNNPYRDSKYTEKLERLEPSDEQHTDVKRRLNRIEEELKAISDKLSNLDTRSYKIKNKKLNMTEASNFDRLESKLDQLEKLILKIDNVTHNLRQPGRIDVLKIPTQYEENSKYNK